MLEVHTTDEFAAWYAALPDPDAEEVATALEVITRLGPQTAAPDSTEWVLWYEDAAARPLLSKIDGVVRFGAIARHLLSHLESPRFRKRLRAATDAQSRAVADAIEALREAAGLNRRGGILGAAHALAASELPEIALAKLQRSYQAALAALGITVGDFPAHSTALRELTLRDCSPRIRLLYGVDAPRSVAVVLLGERLDREHYAASVRSAQSAWQQFLARTEVRPPRPER